MLTAIVGLIGAVLALWQEIRRRALRTQLDAALADQAAAQEAHARAERVVESYRSELLLCEEALRGTSDPAAVRARLRLLLAGDPSDT